MQRFHNALCDKGKGANAESRLGNLADAKTNKIAR